VAKKGVRPEALEGFEIRRMKVEEKKGERAIQGDAEFTGIKWRGQNGSAGVVADYQRLCYHTGTVLVNTDF
jgi:hypothetical protein